MIIICTLSARQRVGQPYVAAALLLAQSGCMAVPPRVAVAPTPRFVAEAFFAGPTEGVGTLRVAFRKPETVIVHGRGHIDPDGDLVVEQTVIAGRKPPTTRQWRVHAVAADTFAGTLSDAVGPVVGHATGNRLQLSFAMKSGLHASQTLDLAHDGQSAHNTMVVTMGGVTVATLDETIRRVA